MKNKNGFVFLESIIVLMVVSLSLALIYSSYTLVTSKSKEKETYDRASDKYLLYTISNLGTTSKINYSKILSSSGENLIKIDSSACEDTFEGKMKQIFTSADKCNEALKSVDVKYLYLIKDVNNALHESEITKTVDNGTIDYIKTLKKCYDANVYTELVEVGETAVKNKKVVVKDDNDSSIVCTDPVNYMVGVFYRSGKYYFASIEI